MIPSSSLLKRIETFPSVRVGVLGDLMVDRFIYGDVERISPEAPVPVVRVRRRSTQPGGAANVACNVLSLGGTASLFGALGDDEPGREVRALLADVELGGVLSPPGYPSTVKTRVVARSQHMLRIDEEEPALLSQDAQWSLLSLLRSSLDSLDVLVVSDYAKGVLSPETAQALIEACMQNGLPVIVDPKPENARAFRGARLLKPNLGEALKIAGQQSVQPGDEAAMRALCETIRDLTGVEEVLVTAGADGLYLLGREGFAHVPGHPRDVFDVAGAGDSTVAAIALALGAGAGLLEAAQLGNLVGSLAVGKLGVVSITASELRHEIELLASEEEVPVLGQPQP